MVKVGIYGTSGYTGQELLRILLRHRGVEVSAVTSRRYAGIPVAEVYPHLTGWTKLSFIDASPAEVAGNSDVVFTALPHGAAMEVVPFFVEAGKKTIDLSADFRLRDLAVYEKWYGKHKATGVMEKAVYGLTELYRDDVKKAALIANPGCYPTSIILGLAPALKAGIIDPSSIIADSKSGVSGAGREPQVGTLFCEAEGAFKAYKVAQHRHTPEIEQELSNLAGETLQVIFTPHLLPVSRGILSTIYANLGKKNISAAALTELYQSFYEGEKFVRVLKAGSFPDISFVCGSNCCAIGVTVDERTGRVIIISAIDNLIKGASGQAVQNMNLMCGFAEDEGLDAISLYP
ncbi:MAG: N-acetyl-gamma-glutamyl-phosphate reductase [Smithellaceae bacterium]|nr:N-acetyl-gamma-glutamyl-phosphate reductase [Smithellaceae bacterium]